TRSGEGGKGVGTGRRQAPPRRLRRQGAGGDRREGTRKGGRTARTGGNAAAASASAGNGSRGEMKTGDRPLGMRKRVLRSRFPVHEFLLLSPLDVFDLPATMDLLRAALAEDLGAGDVTTRLTIDPATRARAEIRAKETAVVAGLPLVRKIGAAFGGKLVV